MSIIKNTVESDTAMTIVRLQKNVALASPPLPTGHPLIGVTPKYYVELNNYAVGQFLSTDANIWKHASGDTVVIKCEIDANSEGTIYGGVYQSQNHEYFGIFYQGGNIYWEIDGTTVGTAICSSGIHLIGWLGVNDNGTKKVQPWYDGAVVSGSTASTLSKTFDVAIGGMWNGLTTPADCIRSTGSWGIRIYEVVANNSNGSWHLYAGLLGSTPIMFETRNKSISTAPTSTPPHRQIQIIQGASQSGITASRSAVDFPDAGYGVQLHDLKILTGSGYNDLLAIVAEDGGIDTAAGWSNSTADVPCKLTKSGESDRSFAFYLGNGSTHVPIPANWSASYAGGNSYSLGELIKGRKPKWSIWSDTLKLGKYAYPIAGGGRKMYFNIFYSNDGISNSNIDLIHFENYNSGSIHAPSMGFSGSMTFEYHNGFCCRTTTSGRLIGNAYDRCCIFPYNRDGGGLASVKVGNLALWNYTEYEQTHSTGLSYMLACGAGVIVGVTTSSGTVSMAASLFKTVEDTGDMSGNDPIPFCSGSNAQTKAMFRDSGFNATSIITEKSVEVIRDLVGQGYTPILTATLTLLKQLTEPTSPNSQVDCSNLVPSKTCTPTLLFDNYVFSNSPVFGHGKDRFIVGEDNGTSIINGTTYKIGILGDNINQQWAQSTTNDPDHDIFSHIIGTVDNPSLYKGIVMGFGLKAASSNDVLPIVAGASTHVMAFMAIRAQDSNGSVKYEFFGFTSVVSAVYDATYNPYYTPLGNSEYGFWSQYLQPFNIYADTSTSYSQTKRGAALFLWGDLNQTRDASANRPSEDLTCWMRVYAQNSGVHSWMPYSNDLTTNSPQVGSAIFDSLSENFHARTGFTASGSIKDIYFHNAGEVLTNHASQASKSNYVDAYITLWNETTNPHSTSSQIKTTTALNGRTITVYEETLHEPQDGSEVEQLDTFTISGLSNSKKSDVFNGNSDSDFHCEVTTEAIPPFYTRLPINSVRSGDFDNTYFYRIRIYHSSYQPESGCMYYIKIS